MNELKHQTIRRLKLAIKAVATIKSFSVGTFGDSSTVRVQAALDQIALAQQVIDAFDWSDSVTVEWLEDQHPERKQLRQAAANAVADNDTFLAISSPTNAQVLAQVRRLTQQNNRVIPRLIQLD